MEQSILHISPTYYSENSVIGGGEKYIVYMSLAMQAAAALRNATIHDSILAFGKEPGVYLLPQGIICEVLQGQPWDPYSIKLRELKERIARANVIVVHQCLSAFGLFVASHSKLANKIVVGLDEGGGEHHLVNHTAEIGRIFDLFHAYSHFCANSFKDIEGKVEVIPGPVDSSFYRPNKAISRDQTLVLAVGRILPHKGFDRIVRALPGDLRLIIAGANYNQEYYAYLASLANSSRVEIREGLTDGEILLLMQTAKVFVQASTHIDFRGTYYAKPELLGLAPLEAMSAGTPTLVSSAGSLPELSALTGCLQFRDDDELTRILNRHAEFGKRFPPAKEIHQDVEDKYGLAVFGGKFLDSIHALAPLV